MLVHPRYFIVCQLTAIVLLVVAGIRAWALLHNPSKPKVQHLSTLPPGWSSGLLLSAAVSGLLIVPQAPLSQAAMRQGVTETIVSTRVKPQAFRTSVQPEQRSLVDWARTIAVYPEPESYLGQKAKVQGFVVYSTQLPEQYFLLTRFVIAHCALDAYPVGFPVKLTESRQAYKPDTWLEVEGQMIAEPFDGKRQLVVEAKLLRPIPAPKNPYEY